MHNPWIIFTVLFAVVYGQSTKKMCGQNGNTDTICSPNTGEIWKNGTWYPISWNPLYPTYVSSPSIDIYIYFVQNYQNTLIKKWQNIDTSKATFPVQVDNSWRLDPTNKTYDSMIYIVPSGVDPEKEMSSLFSDYPKPIQFSVEQIAIPPPVTTTSSVTVLVPAPTIGLRASASDSITPPPIIENSSKLNGSNSHKEQVQPWVIAAIVLACLAVLCACLAIGWVTRHNKRQKIGEKGGEKGHLALETPTSSMFPMNASEEICREKLQTFSSGSIATYINPSSHLSEPSPLKLYCSGPNGSQPGTVKSQTVPNTPIKGTMNDQKIGFMSTPSLPLEQVYGARPCSTASFSNISSRSEPPLTSTDALLIADTFRQRMRCPEWQQQQMQRQATDGNEEEKRRQLSEDLLKKELEAEGTLMKKVGKRAHLLATTYQNE